MFLFWRPLFVWNIIFSGVSFWGIFLYDFGFFGVGFIIKLLGYAGAVYFQRHFSHEKKYFYLNAGQSINKLYAFVFAADFCLYLLLIICYFKFR